MQFPPAPHDLLDLLDPKNSIGIYLRAFFVRFITRFYCQTMFENSLRAKFNSWTILKLDLHLIAQKRNCEGRNSTRKGNTALANVNTRLNPIDVQFPFYYLFGSNVVERLWSGVLKIFKFIRKFSYNLDIGHRDFSQFSTKKENLLT